MVLIFEIHPIYESMFGTSAVVDMSFCFKYLLLFIIVGSVKLPSEPHNNIIGEFHMGFFC